MNVPLYGEGPQLLCKFPGAALAKHPRPGAKAVEVYPVTALEARGVRSGVGGPHAIQRGGEPSSPLLVAPGCPRLVAASLPSLPPSHVASPSSASYWGSVLDLGPTPLLLTHHKGLFLSEVTLRGSE